MDATVDRTKIGSGRALDTAGFRPHAKAGKKADGEAFTGKKAKAGGESSGKMISSGFVIPGLRTSETAKQKEFEDSINQSLIHLQIKLPTKIELSLYQTWFNLKDLADRVCYKVNLEVGCPMKFAVDSVVLPEAQDPLKHGWITVERKKKKVAKNACPLTIQQTPRKTGSMTDMIELVTESVPYSKFPSCKTNGTRKMSQFVKKRQMKLAMAQKSSFVQTKEGPAVRSFGTYGPSGNLQYYY